MIVSLIHPLESFYEKRMLESRNNYAYHYMLVAFKLVRRECDFAFRHLFNAPEVRVPGSVGEATTRRMNRQTVADCAETVRK